MIIIVFNLDTNKKFVSMVLSFILIDNYQYCYLGYLILNLNLKSHTCVNLW